ncbi:MAG: prenyltransferase/squalene oxidase repeat-containing protein [Planctomycetaceae bacterium]
MKKPYVCLALLLGAATAPADEAARFPEARRALERGIAWLLTQQKEGVWYLEMEGKNLPNPGYTALALAPVAASIPKAERAKHPLLAKTAGFLLALQQEDGRLTAPGFEAYENYLTSAALMALVVIDDPAQAAARDRMKDYLLASQRRDEKRNEGGFGYNKQKGADLSNAQYAIEALRAAGIPEDHEAMVAARRYLSRIQNRSENEENEGAAWVVEAEGQGKVTVVPGNDGSAPYEPGVSKAGLRKLPDGTHVARGYGSMTYALLKCYILAGVGKDDARVKAAVEWLAANYTWEENPGFADVVREDPARKDAPYFGLYYYYLTAAKALALVGIDELRTPQGMRDWRKDLAAAIVSRQAADGSWINSQSPRWDEGNAVLVTAYATAALQEILGERGR